MKVGIGQETQLIQLSHQLKQHFKEAYFSSKSGYMEEAIHHWLIENRLSLSTAESCTGGSFSARFVAIPNASVYFKGGVIAYSLEMKQELLNVPKEMLATYGAVSEQVTAVMAEVIREKAHSDMGVGISGILGPGGGSPLKPIGTVCFSIAIQGRPTYSETMVLSGNRNEIREQAIQKILTKLYWLCLQAKS